MIADVAKNGSDPDVRKAVVAKLKDQAVLADVAKNDDNEDVRIAAAKKLKNQAVLADVAKNDNDPSVRELAIVKLTDRAVLEEIMMNDPQVSATAQRTIVSLVVFEDAMKLARSRSRAENRRKEDEMPLRCPKCGTTVMLVNRFDMNVVYESFDIGSSGNCPGCGYHYRME